MNKSELIDQIAASADISKAAAQAIGIYRLGYAKVEISYVLK